MIYKSVKTMIALLVLSASFANAEGQKRYAKPGDGFAGNQPFVALEDGTYYALRSKKVIKPENLLPPPSVKEAERRADYYLYRQRYWESGSPAETPSALNRYFSEQNRKKRNNALRERLRKENWVKQATRSELLEHGAPENYTGQG